MLVVLMSNLARMQLMGWMVLVAAIACDGKRSGTAPVDSNDTDAMVSLPTVDDYKEGECDEMRACAAGQMCLAGFCVAECAEVGSLCGARRELCCQSQQLCLYDRCVAPGAVCSFTEDCPLGEFCEPSIGRCLPKAGDQVCEYRPPIGLLQPQQACRWRPPVAANAFPSFGSVVMTPSVANLTDDNGDGRTDLQDTPDLVFTSFDYAASGSGGGAAAFRGVVRVVSGACNPNGTMNTIATLTPNSTRVDTARLDWIDNSGGIALANLDPDSAESERAPEIIAVSQSFNSTPGQVVAWKRASSDGKTWSTLWKNNAYPNEAGGFERSGTQPFVADLNGDGAPEVIVGNVVLNGQNGQVVWDGKVVNAPALVGVGNNAFLGPNSTAADLDLDGNLEVIAGNTVYDGVTGVAKWTYAYPGSNSSCNGSAAAGNRCDGFTAVGNFDADPEGEVVIVRLGLVYVLNHDGTQLFQAAIPWSNCFGPAPGRNEGGPPTVADFDGDGRAEIGVASSDFYVVIDFDCVGSPLPTGCDSTNIRWKVGNEDCSSRVTGSSVFDFEGDGAAEVLYADEVSFRIFSGSTGAVLFNDSTHRSNTRMEMPLVVDLDNDGKAEVVVPEPDDNGATDGNTAGIDVWRDLANNWVRTRRIWNQHSYHITNISEDGQVPRQEPRNWSNPRFNNFRQNVQPDGLFDATDLQVSSVQANCLTPGRKSQIQVTLSNRGVLSAAAGVPVRVEVRGDMGDVIPVTVLYSSKRLLGGQSETLVVEWDFPAGSPSREFQVLATADADGNGGGLYNECNEGNNQKTSDVARMCGGLV